MEDKFTVPLTEQSGKKKSSRMVWIVVVLAIALGGAYFWHSSRSTQAAGQNGGGPGGGPGGFGGPGGPGGRGGFGGGALPVVVATAEREDLPVYLEGLGSVTAFNTVTVKSRVDGELAEVHFTEGQDVKKGDLLALIDPRPYQAALDQATAALQRDQYQLKDAKLNDDRYKMLASQGVIPQQQSDTQSATAGQLEGAVASDQAQIDTAKINLIYCHITSPIDGRVGLRLVDAGNIVHAADASGMLVITQMEPIAVIFTLPEDGLQAVVKEMGQGQLPVKAFSRDDGTQLATGNLLTIDNEIDPTTGTYKLKAVFDNKDRALWPNQFVNARLLLNTEKGAIVVPTAAIQRGSQGTFVYRVQQGNTVEAEPVTVRLNQGNVTSIASGLNAGDLVVTEGQDRLRAGMTVDPRQATTDADGAPIPGAAGGPAAPADSQASGAPGGPQGFGHGPQGYGQGQDYGHKPQDGSQQGQQFHHDHPQNGGSPDGGSNGYQGKPQSRLGDINGSPVTQQ